MEKACGEHPMRIPLADHGVSAIVDGLRNRMATVGRGGMASGSGATAMMHRVRRCGSREA